LDKGGDDERRRLVEVYNDSQPATSKDVLEVEPLTTWHQILFAAIWPAYGLQNRVDLTDHLWSARLQMPDGALVKDDTTSFWIDCAGIIMGHRVEHATQALGRFSRFRKPSLIRSARRIRATGGKWSSRSP
jgi:hypothetical protein